MNETKFPLTKDELIYFENNEVVCMKSIRDGEIIQEEGNWYKIKNIDLIPSGITIIEGTIYEDNDKDFIKKLVEFDGIKFLEDIEKNTDIELSVDDRAKVLQYMMADKNSDEAFYYKLKKQAYKAALEIKTR